MLSLRNLVFHIVRLLPKKPVHHSAAGLAVRLQAAIDHLQEVQLLVGGLERNIISSGALTALFRAKGRIGQNNIKIFQSLGALRERIPQCDIGIHIVQIGVHQCQAMGFVHQPRDSWLDWYTALLPQLFSG